MAFDTFSQHAARPMEARLHVGYGDAEAYGRLFRRKAIDIPKLKQGLVGLRATLSPYDIA